MLPPAPASSVICPWTGTASISSFAQSGFCGKGICFGERICCAPMPMVRAIVVTSVPRVRVVRRTFIIDSTIDLGLRERPLGHLREERLLVQPAFLRHRRVQPVLPPGPVRYPARPAAQAL